MRHALASGRPCLQRSVLPSHASHLGQQAASMQAPAPAQVPTVEATVLEVEHSRYEQSDVRVVDLGDEESKVSDTPDAIANVASINVETREVDFDVPCQWSSTAEDDVPGTQHDTEYTGDMTVRQLKERCKALGLHQTGRKADLLKRLDASA